VFLWRWFVSRNETVLHTKQLAVLELQLFAKFVIGKCRWSLPFDQASGISPAAPIIRSPLLNIRQMPFPAGQ
jgi:hypothetical protein